MKCIKRLSSVLLSTMLISTVAFADVPDKVAVIGDKAFDLEYVNDPKNVDEIRKLLIQGKPVMVKNRNQWYNNNGEIKEEKYAPFKMTYKNSEGVVEEITTSYFEKQSSIVIGIENSKEIKITFNDELDKALMNKEAFKFNGEALGENDEIIFDEENKVVTIKFNEDIDIEESISFAIGNTLDQVQDIEKNIKIINSQEDLKDIKKEGEFYDITIIGDNLELDLSEVEGNVFVRGSNIKITKLNNENLHISEESEKIVVADSKIENIKTDDEASLEIKDSEVANVNGEEKPNSDKSKTDKTEEKDDEDEEYISPWAEAHVKKMIVLDSGAIVIQFEESFDSNDSKSVDYKKVFTISQNGEEIPMIFGITSEEEIFFSLDLNIEKIDGEWISQNKIIPGSPITIKYTVNQKNGLEIDSKYVKSFEFESESVREFKSADKAIIKIDEGKTFNGRIDNENRVIEIYEDMTYLQCMDVLTSTENGSISPREENNNRFIILIGEDGSIIEYSLVRVIKVEKIIMDSQVSLEEGEEKTLEVKVMPENAENKKLEWATTDSEIVTVDENGNIKALKEGVVTITATAENGIKAQCTVIVGKPKIEVGNVEFESYSKMLITFDNELQMGSESELESLFNIYVDGNLVEIKYAEYNDSSVEIGMKFDVEIFNNEFVISEKFQTGSKVEIEYLGGKGGLKLGEYEIDSFKKTVTVTEEFESVDDIKLEVVNEEFPGEIVKDEIILYKEFDINDFNFSSMIEPSKECRVNRDFIVNGYMLLCGQDGSIKAYSVVERLKELIFKDDEDRVMKIGEETVIEFNNTDGMKLQFVLEGDDVIQASMENNKIAVSALAEGSGTIKIIGEMVRSDGSSVVGSNIIIAKEIDVIPVEVENIVIQSELTITEGDQYSMEADVYPRNATYKEVKWISSNEKVAVIDKNGVITAIAKGEVNITVEAKNGVTSICKVLVEEKVLFLNVSVNNKEAQINLEDVAKNEKMALLEIENVKTGNIEVFNKYDLVEGDNKITFELEKGRYKGYIRISGRKTYFVNEFNID